MATVSMTEVKLEPAHFSPNYKWRDHGGVIAQYKWDAWLYGLVGTDIDAKAGPAELPAPEASWMNVQNEVFFKRDGIEKYSLQDENKMLEDKIQALNAYFHDYTLNKNEDKSIAQQKVAAFLMDNEHITGMLYCEEVSMGSIGVDERDCWMVVTDKRVIIWRDETCDHVTTGTTIEEPESAQDQAAHGKLNCTTPTIPHYVDFKARDYPKTEKQAYELLDVTRGPRFQGLLNDTFGKMQCTKLRHSDMFFYSIPVGQIKGVNLDWKTATLTGHYRVDLNEGVKARFLNSCQCHCFICGKDCCNCCSCPKCDCCKSCCGPSKPCCKPDPLCCHIHPINCYRGCIVKCTRPCCIPCRPILDNAICRILCCAACIPSCWRHLDDQCIQTCCMDYKVGVLRRMDIFRVAELLGNYKFTEGEARFEFESDEKAGVIDTLKTTKHFIRIEYALLNNGPMQMLKVRAGNHLGADEAVPIVKMCSALQLAAMGAPLKQDMTA